MQRDAVARGKVKQGENGEEVQLVEGGGELEREREAVDLGYALVGVQESRRSEEPLDVFRGDLL